MKHLQRLWPYILRYKKSILFGVLSILACSFLRSLIPEYLGQAVDFIRTGRITTRQLADYALFILSLSGLAGCFLFLMRRAIIDASREIEFDFRNDFFRQLERLDPSFYDGVQTGELMSRATNDIEALRMAVGPGILFLVNTLLLMPLVLWRMFKVSPSLTLWSLAPLLVLPPLVLRLERLLHDRSLEVQNQFGRLTTVVQENLAGIRVVKAYVQERPEIAKFRGENEKLIDRSLALARLQASFFPVLRFVAGFGIVAVLLVGGKWVIDGRMQVGDLIAMTILYQMLIWPLIAFGWVISIWQRAAAAMERLGFVFEARPLVGETAAIRTFGEPLCPTRPAPPLGGEIDESSTELSGDAASPSSPPSVPALPEPETRMHGRIELRHLTFRYPAAERPVLHDVTVEVPEGASLGIVGPVGCGKSTLAALLCHLYPVDRGMIAIDGRDINDWPMEALRRQISIVFQESFIFSESIAENVAFGSPDPTLEEGELSEAVVLAHLHSDVEQMPEGVKTLLGERGINLSGGQKQRLSIARALVREPRILVVDDALSAVDTQTETHIIESLRQVARERTTIVIAHRLSALSWCDQIIVLEEGRIAERGTHEELLSNDRLYAELWAKQQLEEEVEAVNE